MKKITILIKNLPRITFGIILILLGVYLPGRSFVTNHDKFYEKIDISKFQGEIYHFNKINIFPETMIENPNKFDVVLNSNNKDNILIYDDDINRRVSVQIYTPDHSIKGRYYHTQKRYLCNYKLVFSHQEILIYKTPGFLTYAFFFVVACFFIIWGIFKICVV